MAGRPSKIPLTKGMKSGPTTTTPRATATANARRSLISPRATTAPTTPVSDGTQGAGRASMNGRNNSSAVPISTPPGRIPISKRNSLGKNPRPTGYAAMAAANRMKDSPGSGESASIRASNDSKGPSHVPDQSIKTDLTAQKEQGTVSKQFSSVPINFLMPPKAEHFVDCCASSSPFDPVEPTVDGNEKALTNNSCLGNTKTGLPANACHANHSSSVKIIKSQPKAEVPERRLANKGSKHSNERELNENRNSVGVDSIQDIQPPCELHSVVSDLTVADEILLKNDASLVCTTKFLENEKPPLLAESATELQQKASTQVQQINEIHATVSINIKDEDIVKFSEAIDDESEVLEGRDETEFLCVPNDALKISDQINNNVPLVPEFTNNKVFEVRNDYETFEITEVFEIPRTFECPEVVEIPAVYEDIQVDPMSNASDISTVLVELLQHTSQDHPTEDVNSPMERNAGLEEFIYKNVPKNDHDLQLNYEETEQIIDKDGQVSAIDLTREGSRSIRSNITLLENEFLPFMIENQMRQGELLPKSESGSTVVPEENFAHALDEDEGPDICEDINLESISPKENIDHGIMDYISIPETIILLNQAQSLAFSGEVFIRNRSTKNLIFKMMIPKNGSRYYIKPRMGYVLASERTQISVQAALESDLDKEEVPLDNFVVLIAPAHFSKISLNQLKEHWKIIQDSHPTSIHSHIIKIELVDVPCPPLPLSNLETDLNSEQDDDKGVPAKKKTFRSNLNFLNNSVAQIEQDVRTMSTMVHELVHWGTFSVYLTSIAVIGAIAISNFENLSPTVEPEPEVQGWFSWIPFIGKKSS